MKTNVVLKSTDRELFGVVVKQDTKGCMLSVTDLQRAYEKARWQYGWSQQNISSMLNGDKMQERIYYLLKEQDLVKIDLSTFMEMVNKEGVTKVMKGLGVYKTTGRAAEKTVMADPYIWVLLAMELNPMLYAKVVTWLTDSLIFNRLEAGSEYLPMNTAIKLLLQNPDYTKYAKSINIKVFGQHQTGMRNLASSKELKKISDIEKFIINAIEQGWLKSEQDILNAIQNYK